MLHLGRAVAARIRGFRWNPAGLTTFGSLLVGGPALGALAAGAFAYAAAPAGLRVPAAIVALLAVAAVGLPVYELGTLIARTPGGRRVSRYLRLIESPDGVEIALDDVRGFMRDFGGSADPLRNAHAVADDVRLGFPAAIRHLEASGRTVRLTATTALMPEWLMKRHHWEQVPIAPWRAALFRWQMAGICTWMRLYTTDGTREARRLPVNRWVRTIAPAGAVARVAKVRRDAQTHAHLHAHR